MRRIIDAIVDRLVATDPGTTRLRSAMRTALSVLLAIGILTVNREPVTVIMLGAIVAMSSAMSVTAPTTTGKIKTFLLLPLSTGMSITASALLEPYPLLADFAFLVVVFFAVYIRKFAPNGTAVGLVAFMTFFFSLFIHAVTGQLPILLLAIVIALCCSALSHLVILPRRSRLALRRMIAAFRARMSQLVDAVAQLIETPSQHRQEQLRRRSAQLHECALMMESELSEVVGAGQFDVWQQELVGIELSGERLAVAARRVIQADVPAEIRIGLLTELREVKTLVGRDPRPALNSDQQEIMDRLVEYASKLDSFAEIPSVTGMRRAIRELISTVIAARRRLITELPSDEDALSSEQSDTGKSTADDDKPMLPSTGLQFTTRQAIQATIGAAIAIGAGEFLSPQRWYWAVITSFVIFANTTSRGDILIRGVRRTVGTLLGILAGMLVATVVTGEALLIVTLIIGCIFLAVYLTQVSYALMTFFMTTMLGLLYSLLGTFSVEVLELRLAETAVGAIAGGIAAVLVLPTKTRVIIRDDLSAVVTSLRQFVRHAVELLHNGEAIDLIDESRLIDRQLAELRKVAEPMVHPISPFRAQRGDLRRVLALLGSCAYYVRVLAANAEVALLASDDRLPETGDRIAHNLDQLLAVISGAEQSVGSQLRTGEELSTHVRSNQDDDPYTESQASLIQRITACFDHLDELVLALARPLGLARDIDNGI